MIKTIYQGWNGAEIQDDSEQGGEMEVSDTLSRVYPVRIFELCGFKCTHTYLFVCTFVSSSSNMGFPHIVKDLSLFFSFISVYSSIYIFMKGPLLCSLG